MKPEDDEPSDEASDDERREAAALAAALERDGTAGDADRAAAPADALETASLLRHARAPLSVPPAHEPIASALAATALDAQRARRGFRGRPWMIPAIAAPAAALVLLFTMTLRRPAERAMLRPSALPRPTADLLAAQAEASRGGGAALATLELKMRAYRRQYHDGLRHHGGGQP
jgi:hypothetical protein